LRYFIGIVLAVFAISLVFSTPVFADSFDVSFNNNNFQTGDVLEISGQIFEMGMPIIAMSIFDPDEKILSANNLEIVDDSFEKSIILDSPFYEKPGNYEIKFDYGQYSENHHFTIGNENSIPEIVIEDVLEPEILLLYTEKLRYTDGDTIEISGLVNSLESPTVLIGIYDPFGMPAGFYFGNVNSDLDFSTSFLVKDGVNFRTDGTYFVKAHYAESEAKSFFEYNKVLDENIPETIQISEETVQDEIDLEIIEKVEETIPETNEISKKTDDEIIIDTDDTIDVTPIVLDEKIITSEIIPTQNESTSKEKQKEKNENKIVSSIETKTKKDQKTLPEKKQNNLTVEDIELGKLLNQINLECDSSQFVDMITYYDGMGPALYRLCKFDSSLNFFNDSLIQDHTNVEVLSNKGSTLGKLGDFDDAILYYDLALGINPDFIPAKNNKANALATLGNLDDAILLYTEILKENPDSITVQKNLQTAISLKPTISQIQEPITSEITNVVSSTEVFEKPQLSNNPKQKSENFIEQINSAFSSLGMLFGFFN